MGQKLETLAFVRSLGQASRTVLLREIRVREGRKDQILVQQGDRLNDVFLLTDGVLRVYAVGPQGTEATLYRIRKGEICLLSLNAAFSNARYPAWVSVESKTAHFALLPGKALRLMFPQEEAIQNLLLDSLTSTVRDLLANLDEILTCKLSQRLERFLARNCDTSGRIDMTHQMLASHLGVAREAVSREILLLKKRKKIRTGRGYLQLISP
jgi:CRP/FNR family transcriptional regulator